MKYNITIANSESEFDNLGAWRIIESMLCNPRSVIGLATGQTTKNMHNLVSKIYEANPFCVDDVTIFGLDEITNVPREYSGACYTMIKEEMVDALGIKEENYLMLPTYSDDFDKECKIFEKALADKGGIDLQILGLGTDGHLGFNQPGTPFDQETWHSVMNEVLEKRVRKETGLMDEELGGITLGIKNIMHSRKIILAAKGESKAEIVREMLYGPITTDVPASILQLHPNCEFILDKESAKYIVEQ